MAIRGYPRLVLTFLTLLCSFICILTTLLPSNPKPTLTNRPPNLSLLIQLRIESVREYIHPFKNEYDRGRVTDDPVYFLVLDFVELVGQVDRVQEDRIAFDYQPGIAILLGVFIQLSLLHQRILTLQSLHEHLSELLTYLHYVSHRTEQAVVLHLINYPNVA